jgi:hypothetical protein
LDLRKIKDKKLLDISRVEEEEDGSGSGNDTLNISVARSADGRMFNSTFESKISKSKGKFLKI